MIRVGNCLQMFYADSPVQIRMNIRNYIYQLVFDVGVIRNRKSMEVLLSDYPYLRDKYVFKSMRVMFYLDLLSGIIDPQLDKLVEDILDTPFDRRNEMQIVWMDNEFSIIVPI